MTIVDWARLLIHSLSLRRRRGPLCRRNVENMARIAAEMQELLECMLAPLDPVALFYPQLLCNFYTASKGLYFGTLY